MPRGAETGGAVTAGVPWVWAWPIVPMAMAVAGAISLTIGRVGRVARALLAAVSVYHLVGPTGYV